MATFRRKPRDNTPRRYAPSPATPPSIRQPLEPVDTETTIEPLPYLPPPWPSERRSAEQDSPAVATIVGPRSIAQIQVGAPSPAGEPTPIAERYRSLPFRPDVVLDGWSSPAITVRAVSQRGHLHRYNGAPRQDDVACHLLPDGRVIALVADGVSGAPQSHLGSNTAVRYAAEWLHAHLDADTAATDWLTLIRNTAWALTERAQTLLGLTEPDPLRAEEQLATTLVCAVIEPTQRGGLRAWLLGVGDSSAWLLSAGAFTEILRGKDTTPDGISSATVVGLPRIPTDLKPQALDIAPGEVLLIGTDGIGDPLGGGTGGVGNLLREVLTQSTPPSLIEFAHTVDFSRETFDDDRTLVALWPKAPGMPPSRAVASSVDTVDGP